MLKRIAFSELDVAYRKGSGQQGEKQQDMS
jgi:hypothetical protein